MLCLCGESLVQRVMRYLGNPPVINMFIYIKTNEIRVSTPKFKCSLVVMMFDVMSCANAWFARMHVYAAVVVQCDQK